MREKIMEELNNNFRPEFLNRVDEIIIFQTLTEKDIEHIVTLQLDKVTARLLAEKKITIITDEKAKKFLAKAGYNPDFGARPLKRVLQTQLLDKLALKIIDGSISENDTAIISAQKDNLTVEKMKK